MKKTSTLSLVVKVVDVNDHVPQFEQAEYKLRIPENNPSEVALLKVTALDDDENENSFLEYNILEVIEFLDEGVENFFENYAGLRIVDEIKENGHVIEYSGNSKNHSPYEIIDQKNYSDITITDDEKSYTAYWRSNYLFDDLNSTNANYSTIFQRNNFYEIKRSSGRVETFYKAMTKKHFSLKDLENQLNEYNFKSNGHGFSQKNNNHINMFRINELSGEIYFLGSLDREKVPHYILLVTARDHGKEVSLTGVARILVSLDDVNDEKPIAIGNHEFRVNENSKSPIYLGVIDFIDRDLPPYNEYNVHLINVQNACALKKQESFYSKPVFENRLQSVQQNENFIEFNKKINNKVLENENYENKLSSHYENFRNKGFGKFTSKQHFNWQQTNQLKNLQKKRKRQIIQLKHQIPYFMSDFSRQTTSETFSKSHIYHTKNNFQSLSRIKKFKTYPNDYYENMVFENATGKSIFSVTTSGQLFLNQSLDRELCDSYYLTLISRDQRNPMLHSITTATVIVSCIQYFKIFSKILYLGNNWV